MVNFTEIRKVWMTVNCQKVLQVVISGIRDPLRLTERISEMCNSGGLSPASLLLECWNARAELLAYKKFLEFQENKAERRSSQWSRPLDQGIRLPRGKSGIKGEGTSGRLL